MPQYPRFPVCGYSYCSYWDCLSLPLAHGLKAPPRCRLTLSQAIDLALRQNRDVKLAQLAVVDSQHKKEIAHSDYFPHISNESAVLHITELAGVDIPAGAFGNHPSTGAIPGTNLFLDQGALTSYTSGTG